MGRQQVLPFQLTVDLWVMAMVGLLHSLEISSLESYPGFPLFCSSNTQYLISLTNWAGITFEIVSFLSEKFSVIQLPT